MATVTFILGLCGSGKTWHADRIVAAGKAVRKFDEKFIEECVQQNEVIKSLRDGEDCVVVEINYCLEEKRQEIVSKLTKAVQNVKIKWLCIENDLDKANKNCLKRKNEIPYKDPKNTSRLTNGLVFSISVPMVA